MPAGAQDARGLGEEFINVPVAMAAFDVHHGVEGGIGEGEILRVAHGEGEVRHRGVPPAAEFDSLRGKIRTGDARGFMMAGEEAGATAAA